MNERRIRLCEEALELIIRKNIRTCYKNESSEELIRRILGVALQERILGGDLSIYLAFLYKKAIHGVA